MRKQGRIGRGPGFPIQQPVAGNRPAEGGGGENLSTRDRARGHVQQDRLFVPGGRRKSKRIAPHDRAARAGRVDRRNIVGHRNADHIPLDGHRRVIAGRAVMAVVSQSDQRDAGGFGVVHCRAHAKHG